MKFYRMTNTSRPWIHVVPPPRHDDRSGGAHTLGQYLRCSCFMKVIRFCGHNRLWILPVGVTHLSLFVECWEAIVGVVLYIGGGGLSSPHCIENGLSQWRLGVFSTAATRGRRWRAGWSSGSSSTPSSRLASSTSNCSVNSARNVCRAPSNTPCGTQKKWSRWDKTVALSTLSRPMLPYGYSYRASCLRPG